MLTATGRSEGRRTPSVRPRTGRNTPQQTPPTRKTAMRPRTAAALAAALAAGLTLSACGGAAPETEPAPTATTAAAAATSATATPTPDPTGTYVVPSESAAANASASPTSVDDARKYLVAFGDLKPFTGPVAKKWGADNVMTAYKEAVTFAYAPGANDSLATIDTTDPDFDVDKGQEITTAVLTGLATDYLIGWMNAAVPDYLNDGPNARAYSSLIPLGICSQADTPTCVQPGTFGYGPGQASEYTAADGTEGITIRVTTKFTYQTRTRVTPDGPLEPRTLRRTRDTYYHLIPNPDTRPDQPQWLVDGFYTERLTDQPVG